MITRSDSLPERLAPSCEYSRDGDFFRGLIAAVVIEAMAVGIVLAACWAVW